MPPNNTSSSAHGATSGPITEDDITPIPELKYVDTPQPHKKRRMALEAAHPELADLAHPRMDSSLYVWAAVAVQTAAAFAVVKYDLPWWGVLALAYTVGAGTCHMLWVLIHDLTHDAVFASSTWNKVYHCIANFPIIFPSAISFRHYHRLHHSHLNEAFDDPDIPGVWENKIFGTSPVGKTIWLFFFAFIQTLRVSRHGPSLGGSESWMAVNWVTQLAYNGAMFYFVGWQGMVYMLLSSMFAIGLHPLGARWIAEHYAIRSPQETYSYYGSFNVVSLNVGYHNEHHDLPNVPWQHLPKVRAIAPEFYETLWYHTSYLRLMIHFLLDPNFTLGTRVVRVPRAKATYLKRDVAPDPYSSGSDDEAEAAGAKGGDSAATTATGVSSTASRGGARRRAGSTSQ